MGNSSPTAPAAKMNRPNTPCQHVLVPQDRQQCAERGGGQRDGHRHEGVHEADGGQPAHDRDGEHSADRPSDECLLAGLLPQQLGIQFVAGQQEEEPQPQSGDQLDLRGIGESQHLWPDHDAAEDEEQHLRWSSGDQSADNRCGSGDRHHQQQRQQRFGAHDRTVRASVPSVHPADRGCFRAIPTGMAGTPSFRRLRTPAVARCRSP